jgi:hypothetical protein
MFAAVTRPLAPGDRAQTKWFDGTPSAKAVAKLIKPSKTLQPLERVEIYNRMYWFRLLECIATDFPGHCCRIWQAAPMPDRPAPTMITSRCSAMLYPCP